MKDLYDLIVQKMADMASQPNAPARGNSVSTPAPSTSFSSTRVDETTGKGMEMWIPGDPLFFPGHPIYGTEEHKARCDNFYFGGPVINHDSEEK